MNWNFSEDRPIFLQIAAQITQSIVNGQYRPGEKLPTVREFAIQAGVNPNTMQRALADIEQKGLIQTRRGDGRYVTDDIGLIKQMGSDRLSLATGEFITAMLALGFDKAAIQKAVQTRLTEGK